MSSSFIRKKTIGKKKKVEEQSIEGMHEKITNDFENSIRSNKIKMEKNPNEALKKETKKLEDDYTNYIFNTVHILNEYSERYNKTVDLNKIKEEYMDILDPSRRKTVYEKNIYYCDNCNGEYFKNGGQFVCSNCGRCDNNYITNDIEYDDRDRYVFKKPFHYEKSSHLQKILNNFQAKIYSKVSPEHLVIIENEIKKNKIEKDELNNFILRELLKKLSKVNDKKFAQYYSFVPYLLSHFNGVPPPSISEDLENTLNIMFNDAEKAFNAHIKGKDEFDNRKSFLHYNFSIRKMLEVLGGNEGRYDHLLCYFPLVKSQEKLDKLDVMWETICKHTGWSFIPTKF